jgi:hypothetical protein
LKFLRKKEQLNFTAGWKVDPAAIPATLEADAEEAADFR